VISVGTEPRRSEAIMRSGIASLCLGLVIGTSRSASKESMSSSKLVERERFVLMVTDLVPDEEER
jgi:hypothetical protein